MSYCLSDYETMITQLANKVRNEAENLQGQLGTETSGLTQGLNKSCMVTVDELSISSQSSVRL